MTMSALLTVEYNSRDLMQHLPLLPAFPSERQEYRDRLLSLASCGFSDLN